MDNFVNSRLYSLVPVRYEQFFTTDLLFSLVTNIPNKYEMNTYVVESKFSQSIYEYQRSYLERNTVEILFPISVTLLLKVTLSK